MFVTQNTFPACAMTHNQDFYKNFIDILTISIYFFFLLYNDIYEGPQDHVSKQIAKYAVLIIGFERK